MQQLAFPVQQRPRRSVRGPSPCNSGVQGAHGWVGRTPAQAQREADSPPPHSLAPPVRRLSHAFFSASNAAQSRLPVFKFGLQRTDFRDQPGAYGVDLGVEYGG